ncbi:MAG: PIN domain-containing protein [Theionarchaea archaeon]|nr:PIN domain-containing protein [Theionarchaea archaeon]
MLYVTDTHAFLWYIHGTLPEGVDSIFKSAEKGESTLFIPTIVLAECLYLVENGKIDLDFNELLKRIEMGRNFIPTSFNFQLMQILPGIGVSELHDRIIVATAKILNAKLITKDREIKRADIVEVVWR